jgi:hypothetical protein
MFVAGGGLRFVGVGENKGGCWLVWIIECCIGVGVNWGEKVVIFIRRGWVGVAVYVWVPVLCNDSFMGVCRQGGVNGVWLQWTWIRGLFVRLSFSQVEGGVWTYIGVCRYWCEFGGIITFIGRVISVPVADGVVAST